MLRLLHAGALLCIILNYMRWSHTFSFPNLTPLVISKFNNFNKKIGFKTIDQTMWSGLVVIGRLTLLFRCLRWRNGRSRRVVIVVFFNYGTICVISSRHFWLWPIYKKAVLISTACIFRVLRVNWVNCFGNGLILWGPCTVSTSKSGYAICMEMPGIAGFSKLHDTRTVRINTALKEKNNHILCKLLSYHMISIILIFY